METLTYFHLALAYEATTDVTELLIQDSLKILDWWKRQKLVMQGRIYWLSLLVILGILGMAGEALAQRTIQLGDRNPQVTFIQNRLQQLGYLERPADGIFDQATQEAVIRFQRDKRLNPDGVVGEQTESALFEEFNRQTDISSRDFSVSNRSNRVLKQGDRGADVTALQRRLRELGYFNGQLTGYFGRTTQEAVSRFQQAYLIQPDGIVGSDTRSALFGSGTGTSQFFQNDSLSLPPPPPLSGSSMSGRFNPIPSIQVLRLGDRGSEVTNLQQELRQRGFNPGRVDGVYGSQTQEAVRQFQRTRGLFTDGIAGRETLSALGVISQARRNRYVVVVPVLDENTLYQVRDIEGFASASLTNSKRGKYVNAGSFPNRATAESRSYQLRSQGLDARVAYFP
ncbi:peptidoglycan-binding protein [Microcoleus sp. FACHB-53]|nr:peptidoglycan-binding protein [Microcoleus sp. FACHB-53]